MSTNDQRKEFTISDSNFSPSLCFLLFYFSLSFPFGIHFRKAIFTCLMVSLQEYFFHILFLFVIGEFYHLVNFSILKMGLHKTFAVPWWPVSKTMLASSFSVLGVLFLFSSISVVSAQYYCLYNFQNTGSNFALVRHAPDPGTTGTWYQAAFVHNGALLSLFLY